MEMAPILVQGIAALEPAEFSQVLARVTRLKVLKPTRNMSENEEAVFLKDITTHILTKKFNYQFIDQGIFNLIEDPKNDKWFPDLSVILGYIGLEHRKLQNRMNILSEVLMRRRGQKQITAKD